MNERPEPIFIGGAPGLDFLNSIATPADVPVEWIGSGEELLDWLVRAGLLMPDPATAIRSGAQRGELDAVAARARSIREWFRDFVLKHRGSRLAPDALPELQPLNELLRHDQRFGEIVSGDGGFRFADRRPWTSPESLLLPIAQALAAVVCDVDFTRVKACEGAVCTLIYADRTRTHARRWCSMAMCGNRAKQAAHRERAGRGRN